MRIKVVLRKHVGDSRVAHVGYRSNLFVCVVALLLAAAVLVTL
jgi:hypothetical protein